MKSVLVCLVFIACVSLPSFADNVNVNRPLILAHYMPWYTAKPASDHWGWHWTMNHFDPERESGSRREIASHYYPRIGPYDSGDRDVLEYHLLLMKLSGIDGVIVDWYGLTDYRDYAVLHRNTTRLLQQCERMKMRFVICYEDQTIPALVQAGRLPASQVVDHAAGEINWLGQYWFQSSAYVKQEGRPVLLSFGHAGLSDAQWRECLAKLHQPVHYFSQDYRREGAVGGCGWPAPKVGLQQVDRFLKAAEAWPQSIPAAFPRFVDIYEQAGVHAGYPELADNGGETFRTTFGKALQSGAAIIQLATWNDWGEGTQIEPSIEFGDRDLRHVQEAVRNLERSNFSARPEDLELPKQLFKARKSAAYRSSDIDAIVEAICSGRLQHAREQLVRLHEAKRVSRGVKGQDG